MPPDWNGFCPDQHGIPTHESTMADLMSRYTPQKVVQAKDGMEVKPDYLYIIPPNKDMGIMNGNSN